MALKSEVARLLDLMLAGHRGSSLARRRTRAMRTLLRQTFQAALDVVYFVLDRAMAAIFCCLMATVICASKKGRYTTR